MSKPKHPREVALEKMLKELDNNPRKAAEILKRLSVKYALEAKKPGGHSPNAFPEVTCLALKMGALALERQADEKGNQK